MPETASCPREVEHVDSTMGAPEVVVAKTNPLPEKEVKSALEVSCEAAIWMLDR